MGYWRKFDEQCLRLPIVQEVCAVWRVKCYPIQAIVFRSRTGFYMKSFLKGIYRSVPMKKALFDALKSVFVPPHWLYQHLIFDEPFRVDFEGGKGFLIFNKSAIENDIYWKGFMRSWEKASLAAWVDVCKNASGAIIDVGANGGIYALLGAAVSESPLTYAFEPHPMFFEWLCQNIEINSSHLNVKAFKVALGSSNGLSQIDDYSMLGASIGVEMMTLDSFVEKYKLSSIAAIKIDIEGMEPEFFEGAIKSIKMFRPSILVEVLSDESGGKLMQLLEGLSYEIFHINDETGLVQRVDWLSASCGGRNFLLKA